MPEQSTSGEIVVAAHPPQPTQLERLIEAIISRPDIDLDRVERFLALKEKQDAIAARQAFDAAMAMFKRNPPTIIKTKKVSYGSGSNKTEYWHADLAEVCDKIIAGLSEVGITHRWDIDQSSQIKVTCWLTHVQGHQQSVSLHAAPDASGGKNSIQALASTVSYLQRYTLLAAVGMATADMDDDARSAAAQTEKAGLPDEIVVERLEWIASSRDQDELKRIYFAAAELAAKADDNKAKAAFEKAKNEKWKELHASR